jgi:hypothetical protein
MRGLIQTDAKTVPSAPLPNRGVAEIPRGFGTPIQHRYILTLQYIGGDEWQLEGMESVTRY